MPAEKMYLDWQLPMLIKNEYLQALAGLVRPAFDYQFFQELTSKIEQAPADEQEKAHPIT